MPTSSYRIAIIGGGPAGLMAAEVITQAGHQVEIYDAMPSVGRKLLMAGKGGLNITHAEPLSAFVLRYAERQTEVSAWLQQFNANDLRTWVRGLGFDTFVGSSGRVFPTDMKAAPLLRAWLHRLKSCGASLHVRHRWLGWDAHQRLVFNTPNGELTVKADATVLALGGGSWAKLGSDGTWVKLLNARGIPTQALQPANCGFNVSWSTHFKDKFSGQPVKTVIATHQDHLGVWHQKQGELMVTEHGVEGGLIYALSSALRKTMDQQGQATLFLDLLPQHQLKQVIEAIAHPRGARSMSSHLQSRLGLNGVKVALLREWASKEDFNDPSQLASHIKHLPMSLTSPRPIDEAISSAGGVRLEGFNQHLMLTALPSVFCAGEMLDWEAPTGGYLLTACFASGYVAGQGVLGWLNKSNQCL